MPEGIIKIPIINRKTANINVKKLLFIHNVNGDRSSHIETSKNKQVIILCCCTL